MENRNQNTKKENLSTISEIKAQKGIKCNVTLKKKSGLAKFTEGFIVEDFPKVKEFVLKEVIGPAVKKTISDIINVGTDMLLYGGDGSRKPRKKGPADRVSYREYNDYSYRYSSSRDRYSDDRDRRSDSRLTYQYDEIIFNTRGEAENVLMGLEAILDKYDTVRVADYYELIDVSSDHTAMNYGWEDLRSANISRVRDGYIIRLPRPQPLN